jgi:hypothetical protein
MPSSLLHRRHAEILARLGSLDSEFEHWRQRTLTGALGRHHSQVRRITTVLGGLLDQVRADLPVTPDLPLLAQGRRTESAILAAHTLWEFFRSKLLLRESALFQKPLAACDDLAWACYRPARDAFGRGTTLREPPLVYFNALWSPFAMPRDQTFAAEIRAAHGLGGALSAERFQAALDQLPIPLVGLPWYQAAHLPSALILAHEVGHVVDWDFHLDPSIDAAIQSTSIAAERLADWVAWRHEVFADLFATCAVGPAFAGALMDLLAATPAEIRAENGRGLLHPPRTLRIGLVCQALRRLGSTEDADRLHAEWESLAGPIKDCAAAAHAPDIPGILTALLETPLQGHLLPTVSQRPATAPKPLAGKLAARFPLNAPLEIRDAFAAARWLHENGSPPQLATATAAIHNVLADQPLDAVRGPHPDRVLPGPIHPSPDDTADRQAGHRLLQTLFP